MKKIMGHLTGKLSVTILSVIVLLVGVLAGQNGITSKQAGGTSATAASRSTHNGQAVQTSQKTPVVTKAAAHQAPAGKTPAMTTEVARDVMHKLPLLIEPNQGQTDSRVKYLARSMGYQVFLTGPSSAVLQYRASEQDMKTTDFVTMKLAGGSTTAAAQPLEPTGGVSNYYLGSDRSKWLENVPHYAKLRYANIYPGIDVVYQGDDSKFRYDFHVNAGADPKAIQIAYEGGKGVSLDKDGNAVVNLGSGRMIASKPVMYQEYGGQKHTVEGGYVLTADNTVGFQVGAYDRSQALVIDPADTYAMYIGPASGTFNTVLNGVGIDPTGPVFVGWTAASVFTGTPATVPGIVGLAVKENLNLTTAISTTFVGSTAQTGTSFTLINGVADSGGTAYIVGATNAGSQWPNIPATPLEPPSKLQPPNNVNVHAFVAQLTGGKTLANFSTLLFGAGTEFATAIAVDGNGTMHITGGTTSGTSVNTPGPSTFLQNLGAGITTTAFQPNQSSSSSQTNAFYVAINKSGVPVYGTLFGGFGRDWGNAIAVDPLGNAYVAGASNSFGAGTVVGITNANEVISGGETIAGGVTMPLSLTSQFTLNSPQGSGCPVNPPMFFDPPIPPADFFGIPLPAQGTALVTDTNAPGPFHNEQVTGITITNPGAGYDPVNQSTIGYHIFGCNGIINGTAIVQNVTGGESANNLPIPGDTITLTSPGTLYSASNPPIVTITGGGCAVEPTASAIVSTTPPFGLAMLVLDTPGTGCTSPPTITIQAPPSSPHGTVTGQIATAVYIPGTANIGIWQDGDTPANYHGFVAKFNPNLPGIASLSYAVAIGGIQAVNANGVTTPGTGTCVVNPPAAGFSYTTSIPPAAQSAVGSPPSAVAQIIPGNVPQMPPAGPIGECEVATSIAVDQYGNAYVGGNSLAPVGAVTGGGVTAHVVHADGPGLPATPGIFNNNLSNVLFTSPGTSGGELNSITITSAGSGYSPNTTVGVYFDWTHDINGQCYIYPSATATTDNNGGIVSIVINNPGFGCTSIPGIGIESGGSGFTGFATLGTAIAGNPAGVNGGTANLATGFALELLSNQIINNGLTTTNIQDGIPLGHNYPSSAAGWPAMVYATWIRGDEACTTCIAPNIAAGFGNGSGPALPADTGYYYDSIVNAIAVDTLGQAYAGGSIADGNAPAALAPVAAGTFMMRRRINAKGYPSNTLTSLPNHSCDTTCATTIATPNTQFLSDFPVQAADATHSASVYPNTGITPYGSVIMNGTGIANLGSFQGVAFDPVTLTACWAGFVDAGLPGADASPTGIFPSGTASQPKTADQAYGVSPGTATGLAACTQFQDDIIVGGPGGTPSNPTPTSLVFTMPAGTTPTLPNGSVNPNFPTPLTVNGTLDGSLPTGASVNLGTISQLYYQGRDFESAGNGPDTGAANDVQWLIATPLGSSIQLSINPSVLHGSPGAPFLDPGIYYCLVTVTPTLTGGVADNANIPQTIIVTLNVTGLLEINTTAVGGVPATGSSADGKTIGVMLSQGSIGTASWVTTGGGVLDAAGNLVLNIPVVANVPLNSPSNSHMVFLLNQGTLSAGLPAESSAQHPVLGNGVNSSNQNLLNITGYNVPIGAATGAVFLTPGDESIENPDGSSVTDVQFLPPANNAVDCSPRFVNPPDTNDPTSKGGANRTVCYIQVIIPPTILQGASPASGPYTATLVFQSTPNLTDPETPVRNDESHPYLDAANSTPSPDLVNSVSPYVENFCVGSDCSSRIAPTGPGNSYNAVPSPFPTASLAIAVNLQAGPLIINSPWISNTVTNCLTAPAAGPGPFFAVPVCNTNGPSFPFAPFTVNSGFTGAVTSNINSFSQGNNPQNTYNNVVLDSRNIGTTTTGTYTATAAGGLQSVNLGTIVSPLQVANALRVYQFFPVPTFYPVWDVPTCTLTSPPIPAGVLTFPASGPLPAANAPVTTTAFTLTISPGAASSPMLNGFYASTITVTPNGNASQATQLPVCLEVGNNVITEFETIPQPTTVPPPFDPTGNITPPDGLVIDAGNTQYVQLIVNTLGPNQIAPLNGGPTMGTPSFVAVPVSIAADAGNPSWVQTLAVPLNIGNEFSIVPFGNITEGFFGANNCSLVTGTALSSAPPSGNPSTGGCLTDAYMDFVIAAPQSFTGPAANIKFNLNTLAPPNLLGATDAPSTSFSATLPVLPTVGPQLVYCAWINGACVPPSTPGVVAFFTVIPSDGLTGGAGYTTVPNIHFTGGCTVEPTAVVSISQAAPPLAGGYVSSIALTTPGSGCTSAPQVTIDPPGTAGGITAAAEAFISNSVLNFTFDQVSGSQPGTATSCMGNVSSSSPCGGPAYQDITVQSSVFGVSVPTPTVGGLTPTIYYNPPTAGVFGGIGAWLSIASVNCQPIFLNPTPLTECDFTLSTNSNVTLLPVGTYQAVVDFIAGGGPPNVQPGVVTALVTLNVTALTQVITNPGSATFSYVIGGAATNPVSQTSNVSVAALPSGVTGIPVTVTPSVNTGPANWIFVSLNGSTAGSGAANGVLTTTGIPLVISVNPAALAQFTAVGTFNGNVTVSTPSSMTSTPTITIPVSITVTGTPSLSWSDTVDGSAVSCSQPNAGGNVNCTATAGFTIGQVNSAPPAFTTVLTLIGSSGDTLTISSNVPWLIPSAASSATSVTPLTLTIDPTKISPLQAGPIVGIVTAKGVNGPEMATFTVTLTVANPPTITMTSIADTTVVNGAAPLTVTTNVGLSSAPFNPTSLPVSCTVTGGGSWLSVASGNPASISATPAAFNFTITPANVKPGNFTGGQITCTTTGGITPALTDNISVHLFVNGTLNDTTPSGTNFSAGGNQVYTIGNPAPTLPMGIWSNPGGTTVSIASDSTWLSVSTTPVTAGDSAANATMVTVSIVTSDAAITGAANGATLTGKLTLSTPQSVVDGPNAPNGLNCNANGPDVVVGSGNTATCTLTIPFTVTVYTHPTISTNPASGTTITFNLPTAAGGPASDAPANQMVAVSASSGSTPQAVQFTATPVVVTPAGGTWLGATGGTTTTSGPAATSTVSITVGSLAQGTYTGSVAYASTGAQSQSNVGVLLNVGQLVVTGGPVEFNHQFGVTTPVPGSLAIGAGPAAINWVASVTPNSGTANCNWLTGVLTSGTTLGGGTIPLSISYSVAGLPAITATYSCNINYSPAPAYGASSSDTVSVTVTLNTSPNPVFVVSPVTAQNVSVLVGATTAPGAPFQVSVSSILAPATSVTATVTPFANNPLAFGTPNPIFTASSSTLTLTTSPITLTINANPTNLPVGTYQGNFTISSPAVSNTAVVTVNLTVYPLGCSFSVTPSGTVSLTNAVPANGSTPVTVPGAFLVTPGTGPGCTSGVTWTATSDSAWIMITGGSTGNGGAASGGTFNALSNTRSNSRTGTITITPSAGSPVVIQFVQPASTAPLLDRQVTSLYQTVLGRDPDTGGYQFWIGIGATQGPSALGLMADSFLVSPESFNTNMAVIAAYEAGTGAPPTYAAFSNSVMQVRLGNQTIAGLFTALMSGNSAYSATTLYQNLLNRATAAGDAACISSGLVQCFQTLIGFSNAGGPTPYFVNNNEFQSTGTFQNLHAGAAGDHSNPLYINMLYFVTLGRQGDQGGLNFWDGIANGGGAGLLFQGNTGLPTRLQIEGTGVPNQGFIGSAEFQSHFQ